jgi:hypothetical protein
MIQTNVNVSSNSDFKQLTTLKAHPIIVVLHFRVSKNQT